LHAPAPLQLPGACSSPLLVHEAVPHETLAPTYPAQVLVVLPSHRAAAHGFAAVPLGQADRPPCGIPTTGVHVPWAPLAPHVSHWPLHRLLQQKPSTQYPVPHDVALVHGWPAWGAHWPEGLQ
jgi:hypothetical protein